MTAKSDLLPLRDIIAPKSEKPNLVENIHEALNDPARTLRDYLFTPSIRGYFDRLFGDVKEGRGGGYWVQAEYGGGKTHFLSTLLCLLGEVGDDKEAEIWANVGDNDMREQWETVVRPRRILGAHLSLMGTTPGIGGHSPLVQYIDNAIRDALLRHGITDSSITASDEIIGWFRELDPQIQASIEAAFVQETGMKVDAYYKEYGAASTANALWKAADARNIRPDMELDVHKHFERVIGQLGSHGFDGLVIVIDEYFSREGSLSAEEKLDDGVALETIGYKLGRQESMPIYIVVASQSEMPAKLRDGRFEPMVLLREGDKEYSQIVCKRIMDYKDPIREQAVLYHSYYGTHFRFLAKTTEAETRGVFPFQAAVFRYLRDLVGSDKINLPSARFAIGVAYDAIATDGVLDSQRFVTRADLFVGELGDALLTANEMRDSAAALRQAWDFVDSSEWTTAAFHDLAKRVVNYLYLDSIVSPTGQTIDQIVEGTLIEDERGMLQPKQIAKPVLDQLNACAQVEFKGETAKFTAVVTEGEQFETIFERTRRGILKADSRVQDIWVQLLSAPVSATEGVPVFLAGVQAPMSVNVDYCGVQLQGRAMYAPTNLHSRLQSIERITQAERARVVFVPQELSPAPAINDSAIAVVVPGSLPETLINEIRGLIACQEIKQDYSLRTEVGASRIADAATNKGRELTRGIVTRQKEIFREGEILTKEGLALNPKQLFRDSLKGGIDAICQQLVRSAYPRTPEVLNGSLAKKGALATADAGKIFDAMLGGVTEAKARGAADAFGPMLGVSTQKDSTRIVANAGNGPDEVAKAIAETPGCTMADLYNRFCEEPYGLPSVVVDLLVVACVFLSKPHALELRPPEGTVIATRDRRGITGPIRANQLRQIVWPSTGLRGFRLAQSKEITWNDFVPIAQAIDPDAFSNTSDHREIETEERTVRERLNQVKEQVDSARNALRALADASGEQVDAGATAPLDRLAGLAAIAQDYSRESALKYVSETWQDSDPALVKADIQRLHALAQLVGEAPSLTPGVSWFRQLVAASPEAMKSDIELAKPLVSLTQITTGPGQLATAAQKLREVQATFAARFRAEHAEHVVWVKTQRGALESARKRLQTLARLNSLAQLGPPVLPTASQDVDKLSANLIACETPDAPDTGNGLSCMSCRYAFGDREQAAPVGERARDEITKAINARARLLSQGLMAEAIQAAGDADLLAILTAIQAGQIQKVIDDDLLTDELVKRLGGVLQKAKQQTVPSGSVYDFIHDHPHVTRESLDQWLVDLRQLLEASLGEAKKANPGKEITLQLKAGDEQDR